MFIDHLLAASINMGGVGSQRRRIERVCAAGKKQEFANKIMTRQIALRVPELTAFVASPRESLPTCSDIALP